MLQLLAPLRHTNFGEFLARSPLRPQYWRNSYAAARTLWFTYGHLRTVRSRSAVDAHGDPLPWYTYPAIEFLKQFDFSGKDVFEYGSGNSTLFWARRAAKVVSAEDDERWFDIVSKRLPGNCTMHLESDLRPYPDLIRRYPEGFDIIVVDGPARGRTRYRCAQAALEHLRPGGLIILDNSDWLPQSAQLLREAGLLQVDMSGFIPIGAQTQTTSLFFHRAWQMQPAGGRQPQPSAGAVAKDWETTQPAPGEAIEWDGEPIVGVVHQQSITKSQPDGVERRFDLAVRQVPGGTRDVYIQDVATNRLLLGPAAIPSTRSIPQEMAHLDAMSWDAFRAFCREHQMRRYALEHVAGT
jgi:hypothetical protein